jgi:hypothetical protein
MRRRELFSATCIHSSLEIIAGDSLLSRRDELRAFFDDLSATEANRSQVSESKDADAARTTVLL